MSLPFKLLNHCINILQKIKNVNNVGAMYQYLDFAQMLHKVDYSMLHPLVKEIRISHMLPTFLHQVI